MKSISAKVRYTYTNLERSACLRQVASLNDSPKAKEGICAFCGKSIFYIPNPDETILELACSLECQRELEWFPRLARPSPVEDVVEVEEERKIPEKTSTRNCPECGGPPGLINGYRHTKTCPRHVKTPKIVKTPQSPQPLRESCPECGGPPGRARGHQHKETCSLSFKNKLAANKKKCPECGGPSSRGRGCFSHTETCSKNKKVPHET